MQVSILLVWLGLNHPQRITTQFYVVLTAPLFLQLFDGQITACHLFPKGEKVGLYYFGFIVLSRPKRGVDGICKIVALQFYSWHVSSEFGAKIQLLTLSTDTLL